MDNDYKPSTLDTVIATPIAIMAAIPIIIGAIIFAPVTIPLALLCVSREDAKRK